MQTRGLQFITVRQVVPAITLTPVPHKSHKQFLTSAPNFMGSTDPPSPWSGLPELPAKWSNSLYGRKV